MDIPRFLQAAHECERYVVNQTIPNVTNDVLYCPPVWDGWGCWNYTLGGTTAMAHCPDYKIGFDGKLFATRQCNPDGTWWIPPGRNKSWSNYTQCVNADELEISKTLIYVYLIGYVISMVAIVISLIIFFYLRQLSCDRIAIHKNLFVSYVFNGLAWILYYSSAALDADVLLQNPGWCQALNGVTQYFVSCNYFWMFCEGLYLHTIIVFTFITGKKLLIGCCMVGWCLPVGPSVVYSILRAANEKENASCWTGKSSKQWIVFGPIIATLLMNLLFLCNIIRVLVTKLRACNNPDSNQARRTARATLILIPLLGLQYIIFPFQPPEGSVLESVYNFLSAAITSLQGLFVAIIFCFCNSEVISVMKRKWGQHRMMSGKSGLYSQTWVSVIDQAPSAAKNEIEIRKSKTSKRPSAHFMLKSLTSVEADDGN